MEDFVKDHSNCFSNDTRNLVDSGRDAANFAQTYSAIVSNLYSQYFVFLFNFAGYQLSIYLVFWTASRGFMLKSTFIYQSTVNAMSRNKGGHEPIQ